MDMDDADWRDVIDNNLNGTANTIRAFAPKMIPRKYGRIIVLSSIAAETGGVIDPHYAGSQAGLLGLMHSYAGMLAKEGITTNAIAPALIETDMIKGNSAITPERIPIGRFGQPNEVAAIALMLAINGYITGQTINVSGGWYMSELVLKAGYYGILTSWRFWFVGHGASDSPSSRHSFPMSGEFFRKSMKTRTV
jgi:3-oxoacyl-[acyl-carrier protein] reductase